MAYSNGVISGAVGMGDISQALGLSSLDLGTLASYAYQNKWAKYKPFVYPAWNFASSAAELAARRSKNCGLVMKDYGNYDMLHAVEIAGLQDHEKRIRELEEENKRLKELLKINEYGMK